MKMELNYGWYSNYTSQRRELVSDLRFHSGYTTCTRSSTYLHGVTTLKIVFLIVNPVRT
jgi:hypothetical protein